MSKKCKHFLATLYIACFFPQSVRPSVPHRSVRYQYELQPACSLIYCSTFKRR